MCEELWIIYKKRDYKVIKLLLHLADKVNLIVISSFSLHIQLNPSELDDNVSVYKFLLILLYLCQGGKNWQRIIWVLDPHNLPHCSFGPPLQLHLHSGKKTRRRWWRTLAGFLHICSDSLKALWTHHSWDMWQFCHEAKPSNFPFLSFLCLWNPEVTCDFFTVVTALGGGNGDMTQTLGDSGWVIVTRRKMNHSLQ